MTGTVYGGVATFQGTAGGIRSHGLFRLPPDGDGWQELTKGLPGKAEVRSLVVHPANPDTVFAGTQDGPIRSSCRVSMRSFSSFFVASKSSEVAAEFFR